ncbi:uncharacterized protein METZ01_LOCUS487929, partial [marine metagenome]
VRRLGCTTPSSTGHNEVSPTPVTGGPSGQRTSTAESRTAIHSSSAGSGRRHHLRTTQRKTQTTRTI